MSEVKTGFLHTAVRDFAREYPGTLIVQPVRDRVGIFAYVVQSGTTKIRHIFCAKRSAQGRLVSVHKQVLEESERLRSPFVLALGDRYFLVYPAAVREKKRYTNEREGLSGEMINFDLFEVGAKDLRELVKRPPSLTTPIDVLARSIPDPRQREAIELAATLFDLVPAAEGRYYGGDK